MRDCKALRSLYSDYYSPSLQILLVDDGCSNLEEFLVLMVGDHPLIQLTLNSTALSEVPSIIVHLRNFKFTFPISYTVMFEKFYRF